MELVDLQRFALSVWFCHGRRWVYRFLAGKSRQVLEFDIFQPDQVKEFWGLWNREKDAIKAAGLGIDKKCYGSWIWFAEVPSMEAWLKAHPSWEDPQAHRGMNIVDGKWNWLVP
jgi:hypothetical protein